MLFILAATALDCFSEDTLEPLAKSVVGLLSDRQCTTGYLGARSKAIALVVYKSRLPAREAVFFSICQSFGLDVSGPFGDNSCCPPSSSDDVNATAVVDDGIGHALVFSLRLK